MQQCLLVPGFKMLKFTMHRISSSLLNSSKLHAPKLASSAAWSHLAPLSARPSLSNNDSSRALLQQTYSPHFHITPTFHSSSPRNDPDLIEEARKRFKHMLSQVDWKEVMKSPQPALVYGAAGLIPFVFPPVAILLNGAFLPNLAFVQLAYGASILSFLGGIKWGFAVPDNSHQKLSWDNLGQSVSLSLLAFGSLVLPPWIGTLTLVGGLGASAYIDITSPGYPQWFKAMRLCLSAVAIGSLLFGLFLRMLF